jgi:hypothetical protein
MQFKSKNKDDRSILLERGIESIKFDHTDVHGNTVEAHSKEQLIQGGTAAKDPQFGKPPWQRIVDSKKGQ